MPHPDRIDFTQLPDGRVVVQKLRRDTRTNPARPRDIPLESEVKPEDFDLAGALAWCQGHGYTVREWTGGARAWKGEPWVIRTRAQIARKRQQIEAEVRRGGGGGRSLLSLDLAYDG
jgi:hypothetical protein